MCLKVFGIACMSISPLPYCYLMTLSVVSAELMTLEYVVGCSQIRRNIGASIKWSTGTNIIYWNMLTAGLLKHIVIISSDWLVASTWE
jgi:hypothetical protein